jgi:hypothetical protein
MGARRFAPNVGRFLQVDVFNGALADLSLSADPLTANRYGLAGGNPLSFIEWDGHSVYADGLGLPAQGPTPASASIPPLLPSDTIEPIPMRADRPVRAWDNPQLSGPGPEIDTGEVEALLTLHRWQQGPWPFSECDLDCLVIVASGVETAVEGIQLYRGAYADFSNQAAGATRAARNLSNRLLGRVGNSGTASVANSRTLARNMIRSGIERASGTDAHHLVAGRGRADASAPARSVLERFGVDINDPANGVFLPSDRSSPNPTGAAVHSTVHDTAYYAQVNEVLLQATTREEVILILNNLRSQLLAGGS